MCAMIQGIRTTSLKLTGAFNESAISCAFSLMLIFLVRTVWIASVKLFCRACFDPDAWPHELHCNAFEPFFAGHRSLECKPFGKPLGSGFGVPLREMSSYSFSSKGPFMYSGETSGNLNLPLGFAGEERRRPSSPVA